jgi:carbon monoxide dehydrogenase subunit G
MWFALRKESLAFLDTAPVMHTCAADVAAPRAAVFAVIADPRTWSAWFPGVREASYASPAPYGVGTIRRAHVGRTHWLEEMIAWDEDARWAYTVTRSTVPLANAQVESFELMDAGSATRVRWRLAFEPRLLARLGAPFAPRIISRLFHRAMHNLSAYLLRVPTNQSAGSREGGL